MKRWAAVGLLLALWLGSRGARAAEVESLRQSGPADKRFNIAVLGDGYRTADQAKLTTDAQGIIDYVFKNTPFQQYAQFFNIKLVHVISNDNGADNGTYGDTRDTALGAYFNCGGIDRLLCVDDGKVATAAAADVPEYNFAIVIVNDPKYGGSGGPVCASSSNEQSFEVLAHEIGHSLAHLADEYSDAGNQPPCDTQQDCNEANVTLRNTRDQVKWKDWVDAATPVPTPATAQYGTVPGLFEGARYMPTGVYRPQLDCKMRELGVDYCAICKEQFVRSFWTADNIQMIESTAPAQKAVQSDTCDPIALGVTTPPITPPSYRYTWTVDGKLQTETTAAIQLLPSELMIGPHDVALAVEDTTAMVRTDLNGVLKDSFDWTVSVTKSDCATAVGGAGGTGGAAPGGSAGVANGGVAGSMTNGDGAGGVATGGATSGGSAFGGAAGAAGAAGATTGGTGGVSADGGAGGVQGSPTPPPHDSSGCSCSVPGRSGEHQALVVAAAGLAIAFGRGRRVRR